MKNQKDILNKIIPADDLYWDRIEKKYIALSEDEIHNTMLCCINNNITDESDIVKVLNWCTNVRVGELLMKGILAGRISIIGVDQDGEPVFGQSSQPEEDKSSE